jgi:prepilin-type N-terminal cleavage/methylation domain-containing protein/prepilin-type processing-associated H-X9-DG protein
MTLSIARKTASPAFTLIELLVAIGIIAILASILFPVFALARARGERAACLSNLHQIGGAAQMYADDNDGLLPAGHDSDSNYGPPASPTGWYLAMEPLVRNAALLRCPADDDAAAFLPERPEAGEAYDHPANEPRAAYTSYLVNGVFTDRWKRGRVRMSGVRHPSDTVLFAERDTKTLSRLGWSDDDDYHPWDRARDADGMPIYWGPKGGLAAARHAGGADYLYADGHVAWRRFSQTWASDGLNQHLP